MKKLKKITRTEIGPTSIDKLRGQEDPEEASPEEIRRSKKQQPLRDMLARGKNPLEATLLFIIAQILDSVNWELDDPFFERSLSTEERKRVGSLRGNADAVIQDLKRCEVDIGLLSPKAWCFEPLFATYWKELRFRELDLSITFSNVSNCIQQTVLDRGAKINHRLFPKRLLKADLEDLNELISGVIADKEQLFLVIGFCLGLWAYRAELKSNLDGMKTNLLDKFTIACPKSEDRESPSAAAVG